MTDAKKDEQFWSHRPAEEEMPIKYRILRCPPKGISNAIVLSHDVTGRPVHYWAGRSHPCKGAACEACLDKNVPRWRGYIFIRGRGQSAIRVFELTAAPMATVDEFFREHRTLRGASIGAHRKNGEANGELYVELGSCRVDRELLPKVPSMKKLLCQIWKIKEADLKEYSAPPQLLIRDVTKFDDGETHVA